MSLIAPSRNVCVILFTSTVYEISCKLDKGSFLFDSGAGEVFGG